MKKTMSLVFALILVLSFGGCGQQKGPDLNFKMPQGYRLSDVQGDACSIIREEDGQAVGGIHNTQLTVKDLRKGLYAGYLDQASGSELGAEFFSWSGGSRQHPIEYVSETVSYPDREEKQESQRILFECDGSVYDMWFETALIEKEEVSNLFYPMIEGGPAQMRPEALQ